MIIGLMSQKFGEIKMTSNDDACSTFIRFDNGVFKINDVLGDGDCFLHSLNISQHINMPGTEELRKYVVQNLRQESTRFKSIYQKISGSDAKLYENWVKTIERRGYWLGTSLAVFISMIFNVNVVLVTNGMKGFLTVDIRKWMLNIGVVLDPNAPNVYIYHHLHKQPFKSSMQCNHFAFMRPHSGETTDYIYENKGYDDEEQDKDAKKQNSVPQKHNSLNRNNVSSENFKKKEIKNTYKLAAKS